MFFVSKEKGKTKRKGGEVNRPKIGGLETRRTRLGDVQDTLEMLIERVK
jgi:hypothetical protein